MLNRQVYVSDNEFIICPIADEDRDNYVELHRQINGEHTLFLNEHCKDMMWEQVLEGEDKVFSVFEINGDCCVACDKSQIRIGSTVKNGIKILVWVQTAADTGNDTFFVDFLTILKSTEK